MIKGAIRELSGPIGFDIGTSDDHVQADLLNGFCKGLKNSMREESDFDMQCCAIVNRLDEKAESVILAIAEFIESKRS